MSYDLLFWRQRDGAGRPAEIAATLSEGQPVAGLDELPIDEIVMRVNVHFPLSISGGLTFWEGGADGMFELHRSAQHVHFCCRQLIGEHCNALIDIMAEFNCQLYDPQVDQRLDGSTEGT
jgi:hypothetical protein